jgi:acetyl-CoA acyltransferase 1
MLIFSSSWTSENVASDFNITRERMDELAATSHQRASSAQKEGRFKDEILPIEAWVNGEGLFLNIQSPIS